MDENPAGDDDTQMISENSSMGGERPPPQEILELDHVYEALSHSRSRYVCYTLLEDTRWTLTDLATKIAAWENDISTNEVTDHQRERVYVSLYHAHVPRLVDEGIITYNNVTEMITPAENTDQVLAALEGIGTALDSQQETHARGDLDDSG